MESTNFHDHQEEEENQFLVDSSCYGLSCYQNHILNGTRHNTNTRLDQVPISVTGSYSEIADIISYNQTSCTEDFMSNNNIQRFRYNNQDLLLKTFSEEGHIKSDHFMHQIPSSEESMFHSFDTNSCYRGTCSQILPTLNVSSLNQSSSSFDINFPALDSFGCTTFNGSSSYQPSTYNLGGLFKDSCLSYDVDQVNSKIAPAFIFEATKAKTPASDYRDSRVSEASPTKKSKLELRPSCTPLKVRKEKLGDRISALQQMVAPFGKTDTASVLTEAIGYIKFLQSQVEGSIKDGNEEIKRDLRSRGLCLVPISCLTYVSYGGGNVWATL